MTIVRTPLSWLKEYVDVDLPVRDLAHMLTMAGTETEAKSARAADWEGIWVGRVTKLERHPNADRLQLVTVDYGRGTMRVVTGAKNLSVGDVVPFAQAGASLVNGETGERFRLEAKSIRGVRSEGTVCSPKELGLGEDHEGIMLLDQSLPTGSALADAIGDASLESELTPNRSDCLGIVGIAREVAALLRVEVREPVLDGVPTEAPTDFSVTIEDREGCPRYAAAFIEGVRVGPSPAWMQERLVAGGMRPINNVVDVTNYVMLEVGQPLHAFDRRQLRGGAIRVRRARAQERLGTLDGVDRVLDPSVLVIADAERAVAIAGIIGGEDSEIADDTSDIVLEVASFEPKLIGRTATALGMHGSEGSAAARRFAWELSPELVPIALRRAVRLLREHAGGHATGAIDVYPERREVPNVRLPLRDFERVLGTELPRDEVLDSLRRIGCRYAIDGELLVVTPPWWRTDISIGEDVVEEAARIIGYDRIPTRLPTGPLPLHERHETVEFRERLRDVLVGFGLQEIVSYALIDPRWLGLLTADGRPMTPEPLRVTNPVSAEQAVARTTLRPSLLDAARRNLRWTGGVAIFEIAPVYLPRPTDLPEERWTVGLLLSGTEAPYEAQRHWTIGQARLFDYADLRGIVEASFEALGCALPEISPEEGAPGLHSGRSAAAVDGDRPTLRLGQLDPRVAERWELPEATFLAELDLELCARLQRPATGTLPSRYPSAQRDLAMIFDEERSWHEVAQEIHATGSHLLQRLVLVDVYRGPQVPEGKKSFAMHLIFQSPEKTLSDQEVDRAVRRIEGRLGQRLGATPRA
jgi:phenylalanyl-tRNA synthetase beta chain